MKKLNINNDLNANNLKFDSNNSKVISLGFTLIELLVVIAIIGLLASIVMVNVNKARMKARVSKRASDAKELQMALEMYYDDYHAYPSTGGVWWSKCPAWGSHSNWIPGLAPNYIKALPDDPQHNTPRNHCCYLYQSNGSDYKLLVPFNCDEMRTNNSAGYKSVFSLIDPRRDGGSNSCVVDGALTNIWAWAVYTPGAKCW